MAKFDAKLALKGAPVKLRNGLKAYVDSCDLEGVFVYGGYVEGEDGRRTWTKQGTEYCNLTSSHDIVSMWEDKEPETKPEVKANIFEKALRNSLQLRCEKSDFEKYYYCIAKTEDGEYLLENKKDDTIERLSAFIKDLNWSVVDPKLPKAFIPKEDEEFWFIHTMKNKTVAYANYCDNDVYYNGLASAGLAFRTKEEATQALHFLRNNIEVNNGKEQK